MLRKLWMWVALRLDILLNLLRQHFCFFDCCKSVRLLFFLELVESCFVTLERYFIVVTEHLNKWLCSVETVRFKSWSLIYFTYQNPVCNLFEISSKWGLSFSKSQISVGKY
ncbi:hypothetical protein HanIR_Chr11g0511691 [Helianthus annuus]|nr:hypothetical protein HanIR_Chr11g0511691 [Helianthus annuus]